MYLYLLYLLIKNFILNKYNKTKYKVGTYGNKIKMEIKNNKLPIHKLYITQSGRTLHSN